MDAAAVITIVVTVVEVQERAGWDFRFIGGQRVSSVALTGRCLYFCDPNSVSGPLFIDINLCTTDQFCERTVYQPPPTHSYHIRDISCLCRDSHPSMMRDVPSIVDGGGTSAAVSVRRVARPAYLITLSNAVAVLLTGMSFFLDSLQCVRSTNPKQARQRARSFDVRIDFRRVGG